MNKPVSVILILLVFGAVFLAACSGGGATATSLPPVPSEYQGKTDPYTGDATAIAAGKDIFEANCVTCHGETGEGNGPAASALDPKPANLSAVVNSLDDDYMFWRISEGGGMAPFNSAMPAQKGNLSEDQIWQVISYVKTLAK